MDTAIAAVAKLAKQMGTIQATLAEVGRRQEQAQVPAKVARGDTHNRATKEEKVAKGQRQEKGETSKAAGTSPSRRRRMRH